MNDNLCVITVIEMRMRGIDTRGQSLVHRIIEPFFTRNVRSEVHAVESAVLFVLAGVALYKLCKQDK